jgi:hypothetical protein
MKIHDLDGNEHDISREEAERIAEELAKLDGKETNEAFMHRAAENIRAVTGVYPKTEDELKKVLYQFIPGPSMPVIELLFESMEWIAGMHSMKTKSM